MYHSYDERLDIMEKQNKVLKEFLVKILEQQ